MDHGRDHGPHAAGPSLWPVGFAVGIAVLLIGLVIGWLIVAIGAVVTVVFAFLWVREATGELRARPVEIEPVERPVAPAPPTPPTVGPAGMPPMSEEEVERFPRSRFLEGATLGIGGIIGAAVTAPVLGFAVAPAFVDQGHPEVDLGPVDNFPEGKFVIATFMLDPDQGEVSRRTAYIRKNPDLNGQPSFTIVSNRCVHLGCPVQPSGLEEESNKKEVDTKTGRITLIPVSPAGFGCPCHGGQYDTEGNRTTGPPVRSLDRYEFSLRNGRIFLGQTYSVGSVEGTAQDAKIKRYRLAGPGEHVDGWEAILYPVQGPH